MTNMDDFFEYLFVTGQLDNSNNKDKEEKEKIKEKSNDKKIK